MLYVLSGCGNLLSNGLHKALGLKCGSMTYFPLIPRTTKSRHTMLTLETLSTFGLKYPAKSLYWLNHLFMPAVQREINSRSSRYLNAHFRPHSFNNSWPKQCPSALFNRAASAVAPLCGSPTTFQHYQVVQSIETAPRILLHPLATIYTLSQQCDLSSHQPIGPPSR